MPDFSFNAEANIIHHVVKATGKVIMIRPL